MKKKFNGSVMLNPVPCVLVTSRNKEGKNNVFTVAWVGTVCTKPPVISISVRPERLSYEYINNSGEFIINIPSTNLNKAVDYCGVVSGRKEDKLAKLKLNLCQGNSVNVGYIDECPISLECKVKQVIKLGSHHMFLADVKNVNIEDELIDEKGKIHFEKANLLCFSHGEYFGLSKKSYGSFGFSVKRKKKKRT
ncbi:flavin reductase family protein [Clostridium sp. DL1XJH146]